MRYTPTDDEWAAINFLRERGFAVVRQATYDRLRARVRTFKYGRKIPQTKAEKAKKNADRKRDRRAQLLVDPSIVEHGVYTTYTGWGCDCEPCREAWRVYGRDNTVKRRKKKKYDEEQRLRK